MTPLPFSNTTGHFTLCLREGGIKIFNFFDTLYWIYFFDQKFLIKILFTQFLLSKSPPLCFDQNYFRQYFFQAEFFLTWIFLEQYSLLDPNFFVLSFSGTNIKMFWTKFYWRFFRQHAASIYGFVCYICYIMCVKKILGHF